MVFEAVHIAPSTTDYSMTEEGLGDLVRMLQAHTPLVQLSNMEARAVFELMQQRGYKITVPADR